MGSNKNSVTLLEYGDFQCPSCGQYYPILKELKRKYSGEVEFQFSHFPLDKIHPHARAAHRAAEAAGLQGKFFEMHDLLYENQQTWSSLGDAINIFTNYAKQLNLDMTKFDQDMRSGTANATINSDVAAGQTAGATGTPTFVLNGKKLDDNPRDLASFSKVLEDAVHAKNPSATFTDTTPQTQDTPVETTQTPGQ